jgi:predicted nucleic acid-binding protein
MKLVVDASVIVKWYVDEADFQIAGQLLLNPRYTLIAPGHAFAEVGNALATCVRRRIIARDQVREIGVDIVKTLQSHPIDELLPAAIEIALDIGSTVYDSFYIALAAELDTTVATADERLVNLASRSAWRARVRPFSDLVEG